MGLDGLKLSTTKPEETPTPKSEPTTGDMAAASREGATTRPHAEEALTKPPETDAEVETRRDPTQPVSGDSNVTGKPPEKTFLDPPTPGEERKNTLESNNIAKSGEPSAEDGVIRYSSHPILNYHLGRFDFENGLLELKNDKDVEDFEKLLSELPTPEQLRIKKLDLSAAEAQVRAVRESSPHASKKIGSDSGDRDPGKQVGKGILGGQPTHGE